MQFHFMSIVNLCGDATMTRIRVPLTLLALLLGTGPALAQGSEEVVYFHSDAIGSVRLVTGANGQVMAQYDYLPFGEPWQAPALPETRRFGGKERDAETGLDYFGARYYSSLNGRFTVVDPVLDVGAATTNPQRWNRYAYGSNNPFRNVDPDGRDTLDLMLGFAEGIGRSLVGAVTGIVTTPYALATDLRGTVNAATAAASDHMRLLAEGVNNPSAVWDAYAGLATSNNDADQRTLGAIIGGATGVVEAAVLGRAAAKGGRVEVTHFTDAAGKASIEASGQLRAGTYVTKPGQVSGLGRTQVESRLEIGVGKSEYSVTVKVNKQDLMVPQNGAKTSGGAWQRQLRRPCAIPSEGCVPTPE